MNLHPCGLRGRRRWRVSSLGCRGSGWSWVVRIFGGMFLFVLMVRLPHVARRGQISRFPFSPPDLLAVARSGFVRALSGCRGAHPPFCGGAAMLVSSLVVVSGFAAAVVSLRLSHPFTPDRHTTITSLVARWSHARRSLAGAPIPYRHGCHSVTLLTTNFHAKNTPRPRSLAVNQ